MRADWDWGVSSGTCDGLKTRGRGRAVCSTSRPLTPYWGFRNAFLGSDRHDSSFCLQVLERTGRISTAIWADSSGPVGATHGRVTTSYEFVTRSQERLTRSYGGVTCSHDRGHDVVSARYEVVCPSHELVCPSHDLAWSGSRGRMNASRGRVSSSRGRMAESRGDEPVGPSRPARPRARRERQGAREVAPRQVHRLAHVRLASARPKRHIQAVAKESGALRDKTGSER